MMVHHEAGSVSKSQRHHKAPKTRATSLVYTTALKEISKIFFLPLQTTSYPLHTTTYVRLCKSSPNCAQRLRVVHRMGTKTIAPAHRTDPGTGDDDRPRSRLLRPIGGSSPWDPSARETRNRLSRYASKRSQTERNTIFVQYRYCCHRPGAQRRLQCKSRFQLAWKTM